MLRTIKLRPLLKPGTFLTQANYLSGANKGGTIEEIGDKMEVRQPKFRVLGWEHLEHNLQTQWLTPGQSIIWAS